MKAEIIAVGTELLLGQIVNSNAQFLSRELADLGIDVYFQTVVGDNVSRIKTALDIAVHRADLIILTGGLGPTQDDLTKNAVADFTGAKLSIHQPTLEKITEIFRIRGLHMAESNARQALIIDNSAPLRNETGLAVGVALTHNSKHYILLPGPPREMKPMFENEAKPWLRTIAKDKCPLYSKVLKFAGIGESSLEHGLLDLIQDQQDPTIAPYAKEGEVMIRLTTRAATREEAMIKIAETETKIRSRLNAYIFADEDISLEESLVRLLKKGKLTLSAAESCTGGLLSHLITSIPGSSEVFFGGMVCYTNDFKASLLQVPRHILEGEQAPGAVSPETAKLLAEHMNHVTGTNVSVSITGLAGPTAAENKPVGLVYIGIARQDKPTVVEKIQLSGNRESIKLRAAKQSLYFLWKMLANPSDLH